MSAYHGWLISGTTGHQQTRRAREVRLDRTADRELKTTISPLHTQAHSFAFAQR